jgi:hypothetical protein
MQLTLESDEARELRAVLAQYLSDLRMEIGRTDDRGTRQTLHRREAVLTRLIAQIDAQGARAG